jgi:hypothetical protein
LADRVAAIEECGFTLRQAFFLVLVPEHAGGACRPPSRRALRRGRPAVPQVAGQRSMALIGRIGTTGASFLVGASGQFTATTAGVLYLAPNDTPYTLWDNSGSLSVTICVASASPEPASEAAMLAGAGGDGG